MFAELVHLLLVILSGVKLVMLPLLFVLDLFVPDVHLHLVTSHLPGDLVTSSLLIIITTITVITITVLITLMLLIILGIIVLIIHLLDARQFGQSVLDLATVRLGLVFGQSICQLGSHLLIFLLEIHLLDTCQGWKTSPLPSSVPPPLFLFLLIPAHLAASSGCPCS